MCGSPIGVGDDGYGVGPRSGSGMTGSVVGDDEWGVGVDNETGGLVGPPVWLLFVGPRWAAAGAALTGS